MKTEPKQADEKREAEKFNSYNEFLRRFYPDPEKIERIRNEDQGVKQVTISSYMTR